jgi:flagellar basal body-associated protein FliL
MDFWILLIVLIVIVALIAVIRMYRYIYNHWDELMEGK